MKLKARSSRNFFECDVNEFSVCFLYLFLFFLREETTTSFRLLFEYRCAYIGRSTNSTTSLYRDIFYFFEKLCVDTSNQTSFRFYEAKAIGKTTAGPPVVLFFRRRSFFSLSHITPKKTRSSCFGLFATWPLINTHTKEEQGIISSSAYSDRQRVLTFGMANCGQEIFQIFLHINLDNNNMSFIEMGETCLSPKVVKIT